MSLKNALYGAIALCLTTLPAVAGDIVIHEPYFRTASPIAQTGGAFMEIQNHTDQPDRLISATSDIAKRIETHTHIDAGNGVIQMREVEGGFVVPAGGHHMLARGGDHLMFMGLTREIIDGESITVILTFENAGEISVKIPIDQMRKPGAGAMDHKHN